MHVGDRLLTQGSASWDPDANKSILIIGRDACACVSYSGLAHINGTPTDQWLAEHLSGHPAGASFRGDGGAPLSIRSVIQPRIGLALHTLPAAIERDYARQTPVARSNGLRVLATGFLARRQRSPRPVIRPFMLRYTCNDASGGNVVSDTFPKYWDWFHGIYPCYIGQVGTGASARLRAALDVPGNKTDEECERLLVACVRATNLLPGSLVGPHCVSVMTTPGGYARVRFLPEPTQDDALAAYTPWVIGPGIMQPPQIMTGGLPHIRTGGYHIDFERLPPLGPAKRATGRSQPRKLWP